MNRIMIASMNDRYHSFDGDGFDFEILKHNDKHGNLVKEFYDLTHMNEIHPEMELSGDDEYFVLYQSDNLSGVLCQGRTIGNSYQSHDSPAITAEFDVMLNTSLTPILSIDTLIAYMPHIPWNEFGEYIILNKQDGGIFKSLWTAHIKSIQPFIRDARINYPDCCRELFFFRSDYK